VGSRRHQHTCLGIGVRLLVAIGIALSVGSCRYGNNEVTVVNRTTVPIKFSWVWGRQTVLYVPACSTTRFIDEWQPSWGPWHPADSSAAPSPIPDAVLVDIDPILPPDSASPAYDTIVVSSGPVWHSGGGGPDALASFSPPLCAGVPPSPSLTPSGAPPG